MTRHIDVETAVDGIRAQINALQLPANAPIGAIIQKRYSAIEVEILRMILTEENRSTEMIHIIDAMARITSNFMKNFLKDQPEKVEEAALSGFLNAVYDYYQSYGNGKMAKAEFEISDEPGGHA